MLCAPAGHFISIPILITLAGRRSIRASEGWVGQHHNQDPRGKPCLRLYMRHQEMLMRVVSQVTDVGNQLHVVHALLSSSGP